MDVSVGSNSKSFEYTCVLTSCNRFDVLEKTLVSLFKFIDIKPLEFIIIEDSGNRDVLKTLEKFDFDFNIIINPINLGQAKSIDIAYANVKTPYIFHCEDDWEFTRTGFIQESFKLLQYHPEVSLVQLRGRAEHKKLEALPSLNYDGLSYFLANKKIDKRYFSYGYNPSLRRLVDYKRIGYFEKIGGEREVSWVFKKMGFVTAHLEQPAVRHLGDGLHIDDNTASKKGLCRRLRSLNNIIKRAKWAFTGFPEYRVKPIER